jgi:hypothetical protein
MTDGAHQAILLKAVIMPTLCDGLMKVGHRPDLACGAVLA